MKFIKTLTLFFVLVIAANTKSFADTNTYELTEREWLQFPEVVGNPSLKMYLTDVSDILQHGKYTLDVKIDDIDGEGEFVIDFYGDDYDPESANIVLQLNSDMGRYESKFEIEIPNTPIPSNVYLRLFTHDKCVIVLKKLTLKKQKNVLQSAAAFVSGLFDFKQAGKSKHKTSNKKISLLFNTKTKWQTQYKTAINENTLLLLPDNPAKFITYLLKTDVYLEPHAFYKLDVRMKSISNNVLPNMIGIDIVGKNYDPSEAQIVIKNSNIKKNWKTYSKVFNSREIPGKVKLRAWGTLHSPLAIEQIKIESISKWRYILIKNFEKNFDYAQFVMITLAIIIGICSYFVLRNKKILFGILSAILIIAVILGLRAENNIISFHVVVQILVALIFNLISGWWLAYYILPDKWKWFTLPLSLPMGHITSASIIAILCSLIRLPFEVTLYFFICASLIADIICFYFIKKKKSLFKRELLFPFVVAAITFACLLFPVKNKPVCGLYSNCIDGVLYTTFSEYVQNPVEAKQTWNLASYNYGKAFSKEGYKDIRESSAFSLMTFSKLLGEETYESFRIWVIFTYIMLPIMIYLIIRKLLKLNVGVAFLSSLFVGISPILAFSAQNNSLSQVQGQVGLLLIFFLIIPLFKNKFWKEKNFWFLIIGLGLCFLFVLTSYFKVLKLYIFVFSIGTIAGLLSYRFKSIKWLSLISVCLILAFYGAFRMNLLKTEALPSKIQEIIAPTIKITGDIRTRLNPIYVCGMFDIVKPTGSRTNLKFPVVPKNFIYILDVICVGFIFIGFLSLNRKVKFIIVSFGIGLLLVDIILRFHYQWAYALKKHLGVSVPFVGLLWGCGVVFLISKSKNKFWRLTIIIISTLILLISGYAVVQTGNYWLQKNWYFNKETLQLIENTNHHVDKNTKIFVKPDNRIEKYLYLLRKWRNLSSSDSNCDFAIVGSKAIGENPTAWFADPNQHILLFETEKGNLVKKK